MSRIQPYLQRLLAWLRANPLGPALTVVLTALIAVFVLPQITLSLFAAPRLLLAQVLISALIVPLAVVYVHETPWKALAGTWGGVYLLALLRAGSALRTMTALQIGAHMTFWFLIGFLLTAVYALWKKQEVDSVRTQVIHTNLLSTSAHRTKLHAQ